MRAVVLCVLTGCVCCGPQREFLKLLSTLSLPSKLPEYDVDYKYMKRLSTRMGLARKICALLTEVSIRSGCAMLAIRCDC